MTTEGNPMTKKKSWAGSLNLEQTSVKIVEFESIGWVLSSWTINEDKNEFVFEVHPEGRYPAPCVFRRKSSKALAGFKEEKSGKLLDGDKKADVVLYRWQG